MIRSKDFEVRKLTEAIWQNRVYAANLWEASQSSRGRANSNQA